MKVVPIGVILVLMSLSFLTGFYYSETRDKASNNGQSQQENSAVSKQQSPTDEQRFTLWWSSSEVSPNSRYKASSYTGDYADYDNYYQIFVADLVTHKMWRIYSGDFRTFDWKWTDDNRIKITHGCGTGCRATKLMNVNETYSMDDERKRFLSEENGWKVEFFKSF